MSSSLVLYPRKLSFDIPPQFWVSLFLGEKLANEWGWNDLIKSRTSGSSNTALLQSTLRPKVESCDKISSPSCNLDQIIPIIQPQIQLFRFSTTPENVKICHCYLFRKNHLLLILSWDHHFFSDPVCKNWQIHNSTVFTQLCIRLGSEVPPGEDIR